MDRAIEKSTNILKSHGFETLVLIFIIVNFIGYLLKVILFIY